MMALHLARPPTITRYLSNEFARASRNQRCGVALFPSRQFDWFIVNKVYII